MTEAEKDARIELLEEAVRIQNAVMERAMEASDFWRDKAMELLQREVNKVLPLGGWSDED